MLSTTCTGVPPSAAKLTCRRGPFQLTRASGSVCGDVSPFAPGCDDCVCVERLLARNRSSRANISVGVIGAEGFQYGVNTFLSNPGVVVIAVVINAWSRWL